MENQIVKINPIEFGIEEVKAQQIAEQFKPMLDKMVELEKEFNEVVNLPIEDLATAKKAKELRLKYVKVRTGTAAIHKEQKDFYLKAGRFIDGWKNSQLFASQGIEERLESIENHAAILEAQRLEKLREERNALLIPFGFDVTTTKTELMTDDVFNNFLTGVKLAHEQKIEAEKKAEAERIAKEKAEAEEREKQRLENIRLKAEAEAKEKQLQEERAKAEAEKRAIEEKAAKEKAIAEAKAKKEREEQEKKLKVEREAKEKLEKELKEKQLAEAKKQYEEEQERKAKELAAKKAEKAPDIEKLRVWINELKLSEVNVKGEAAAVKEVIDEKFNAFKVWALTKINGL